MAFTNKPYEESEAVKQARLALESQAKPTAYQSQYQSAINDTLNKINNREKFTYDVNGDALYQQYKDKYIQQGKMAMQDTMGQAAALTGGYGNSYAASAGNQAYLASLQNLNDVVPELYKLARDQYDQEGQDLLNKYSLLSDQESRDYGRYRDSVADYNAERAYLADTYNNERSYDYGVYADDRNLAYQQERDRVSDEQWNASMSYQKERDAIADLKPLTEEKDKNPFGMYSKDNFVERLWNAYEMGDEASAEVLRDTAIRSGGDVDIISALYYTIWGEKFEETEPSEKDGIEPPYINPRTAAWANRGLIPMAFDLK